jgi:hypothetical protein
MMKTMGMIGIEVDDRFFKAFQGGCYLQESDIFLEYSWLFMAQL